MATGVLIYLDNCIVSDVANTRKGPKARASQTFWRRVNRKGSPHTPVTSAYIYKEATSGSDTGLAAARLRMVSRLIMLPAAPEIARRAHALRRHMDWTDKMHLDALHIAAASFHRIPGLVTWDGEMLHRRGAVYAWLLSRGYYTTAINSPEDFVTSTNPPASSAGPSAGMRDSRTYRDRLGRAAGGSHAKLLQLMDAEAAKNLLKLGLPLSLLDQGHTRAEVAMLRRARRQKGLA